MPSSRDNTAITEASIKAASKQFDLSVVFKLSMARMGIQRIENLTLVPSLTELDLSANSISRIEGLEGLESLKRLVLSSNRIEKLKGMETLEALETLQLQGNKISNIDDVQCLSGLQCLRHFQLQVKGGNPDERNPMCDHPAYRAAIRRMLPTLQTFDGERTVLQDAALPQNAGEGLAAMTFPEPEPWLKDFDLDLDRNAVPARGGAGRDGGDFGVDFSSLKTVQQFDQVLVDFKRLNAKAVSLIEDYQAKTPR